MLHKAPDCGPEPQKKKNSTCSKYVLSWFHENSLSHNFAKDERKQHTKNPVIIFK